MDLATLDCATSNPSLSNSPWAPKRVLDAHSPHQSAQLRADSAALPRERDLQRQ
jgi:hypothetical protein